MRGLAVSAGRVAVAGLLLGIAACTTLRRVQPSEYLEENSPQVVWVTYTNNTIVPVAAPVIHKDTLRGWFQGKRERVKIPLREIQNVQAKIPDHRKTALLATTLGVATVSAMYYFFISKAGSGSTLDCTQDEITKHPALYPECGN